ncbi:MAG: hypothetical protein HYU77_04020 [Betaproteobacteria bacterium]|nr:hypothetical protein [Betaproteobacteria bacterium]
MRQALSPLRRGLQAVRLAGKALRLLAQRPGRFLADAAGYLERQVPSAGHFQFLHRLPGPAPLNLRTDPALAARARLNVLVPGITMQSMSGGPNTALNLARRMAGHGVPVRLISTDVPLEQDPEPLRAHLAALSGISESSPEVEFACGHDRSRAVAIGENDVFMGTAWWTVRMIKHALALTRPRQFIYLIQDFEPGFYPWSTEYALALETYGMNFRALINESLLAEYLCAERVGRFADPSFIERCAVFEPAIDGRRFYAEGGARAGRQRRLLFYARPTIGRRNLFEISLYALRQAVEGGVFSGEAWEMLFIGETIPDIALGHGITARSAPWMGYDDYADLMRHSDILLSMMLSPHTSYPPLEQAACGGIAVTTSFAGKTADRMRGISPNIVAVPPTAEGIAAGLEEAVRRVRDDRRSLDGINMPRSWDEAFAGVVPKAVEMFHDCRASAG